MLGGHRAQAQGEAGTGGIGAVTGPRGDGQGAGESLHGFIRNQIVEQLGGASASGAGYKFGMIDPALGGI